MMKIAVTCAMLLFVINTIQAQSNNATQMEKQKKTIAANNTMLNDSPLTSEELNSKDKIQANRNTISDEDMQTERVLYYDFKHYDNVMSIRVLNYIMNNASVKKLAITRSSFAIMVTEDFDSTLLEKNIQKTGLTCKLISKEAYLETVKEISLK